MTDEHGQEQHRRPEEEALARGLDRRAERVLGAPLSMADVRRRAHTIRRRRVAAATAAVAAAVAAVVVVPAALGGAGGHRGPRPEPAPPVPTATAAPGQASAVLHDGRLSTPGGGVVSLPLDTADVGQLALLADGRVVVTDQRTSAVEVYAADGSLQRRYPVRTLLLRTSADGDLAAWVDRNDRVEVLESGVAEPVRMAPVPMPGEAAPTVDAVLGSGCADGGCAVLAGDGSSTLSEVTVDGARDVVTPEPMRVDEVSPDGRTWAVTFPPTDAGQQYGCVGLYDPAARRVTARTCETAQLRFSPDGRHLVGGFFDNGSARAVQVLDDRLDVVRTYDPGPAVVSRVGWTDAGRVLAATADAAGSAAAWSLVTVAVDGGDPVVEEGPVDGRSPEQLSEFVLSE